MTELREPEDAVSEATVLGACKFALCLLLAGYILFAHGCHADEDNELFTIVCPQSAVTSP